MSLLNKYKVYIISILIPLVLGTIIGLITNGGGESYQALTKPFLTPPSSVFPIIWSILYILMGISAAIIYKSSSYKKYPALRVYTIQLGFNLLWSIIFFNLKMYLLSFVWLLILLWLIIIMIDKFYRIDIVAARLQIPYLIWVIFAGYLNLMIYILN